MPDCESQQYFLKSENGGGGYLAKKENIITDYILSHWAPALSP
jgi:hypothetical protein